MSNETEITWNEYKSFCLERMSKKDSAIETYLSSCRPESLVNGLLTLSVPTPFGKRQIEDRFLAEMKALFAETGFGNDIVITVRNNSPAPAASSAGSASPRASQPPSGQRAVSLNGLNPNYVFSTFIVGKSNRLPHAACVAVAETPGESYNPLFIWGNVGLGKTHLMQAIGHKVLEKSPGKKVLYVSAEQFTNELINSIRTNTTEQFRKRYRGLDILMIDDIQFISNKEQTQEEFFHTFNTLYNAKKQIIISSDRAPKNTGLEDRLVSRFQWGLSTDIQQPDLETRVAILQKKAEIKNQRVPDDVILFIAQNIPSNIRELEGTLNRVIACSELNDEPMTLENVTKWLKDLLREGSSGPIPLATIQQLTAETFNISIDDLVSQKRTADLALARQIAMYVAREKTKESLQQIGYAFNKKDHTTVIHAIKKIEEMLADNNSRVKMYVENIENKL